MKYTVAKNSPAVAYCFDVGLKEYDNYVKIFTSKSIDFECDINGIDKSIWDNVIKLYKGDDMFFLIVAIILGTKEKSKLSDYIRVFDKDGWLLFVPSTHVVIV